jgi:hypothetical protein
MGFHETNNTSIDHNLYADDQFIYESNYRSGVRVFDDVRASDAALTEVAFFDLVSANDNPQLSGTWSNYPYLPSGVNIATSMYDGFFITKPTFLQWSENAYNVCQGGGFSAYLEVNSNLSFPLTLTWELPAGFAANGISLITQTGNYFFYFDAPTGIAPGVYELSLNMTAQNGQVYTKVLRVSVSADSAPTAVSLLSPVSGVSVEGNPIDFSWSTSADANYYVWTMATDVHFLQNVQTQNTTNNTLSLNAIESGMHYWKVEAMNDCGSSSIEVGNFDLLSTGVNENEKLNLQLFPNPSQSVLYFSQSLFSFTVLDITGRIVYSHSGSAVKEFNTEHLSNGMYWMKFGNGVKSFEVRH